MYINSKDRVGPYRTTLLVDRATGKKVGTAFAADTDAGWYDMYAVDPATGLVKMTEPVTTEGNGWRRGWRRGFIIERVTKPFDLVDRYTGEVLAES